MRTNVVALFTGAALSLFTACKSPATADGAQTAPPNADTAPAVADTDAEGKDPSQANVSIDPRITEMCGIDEPNFAFNSASLSPSAKRVLNALAVCFTEGAAADRNMRLVGHADPRGDEEYNFGLGQQRADNVSRYLGGKGLGAERLESSSRGELDAVGTDDESWKRDRKVEILLAE